MALMGMRFFQVFIFISLVISAIHYHLQRKKYTFRATDIQKTAEKYKGQHPDQCLGGIMTDLTRRHDPHVRKTIAWNQVHFGGVTARLLILHASLTEFVGVYGVPIGGVGFSGVHWANVSCTMLVGSVERWTDKKGSVANYNLASPTKPRYRPGETYRLSLLHSSTMKYSDDTWLVCYGRGFLPASFPFILFSDLLKTFDVPSMFQFLYVVGEAMFAELVVWVAGLWLGFKGLLGLM